MSAKVDVYGLHLAAFLLGGTALFAKLIALPTWDITAFRGAIAGLILGVISAVLYAARNILQRRRLTKCAGFGVNVLSRSEPH